MVLAITPSLNSTLLVLSLIIFMNSNSLPPQRSPVHFLHTVHWTHFQQKYSRMNTNIGSRFKILRTESIVVTLLSSPGFLVKTNLFYWAILDCFCVNSKKRRKFLFPHAPVISQQAIFSTNSWHLKGLSRFSQTFTIGKRKLNWGIFFLPIYSYLDWTIKNLKEN